MISVFEKTIPDIVVVSAAFTNVDDCETHKKKAFDINVVGVKLVCEQIQKFNARCVYVSTDYVFNGEKGNYLEIDKVDPIDYYGVTKLKAEKIVSSTCLDYLIMRPSVIFGTEKQNFVTWIIDSLKEKKNINIVTDQYVSPTLNTDFARQLESLLDTNQQGVFHCSGGERISRFDFACLIADVFSLDKNLINPVKMVDMNWFAKRPMDSSLDVSKVSAFQKPLSIKESLNLLYIEMEDAL
ncbi:MAG: dTDP-4-dehydrorhamnose reductase [Thermoplasmata archaeon]|nr:MAG: dTDP-4-dehydrorhamnose reductase [Thermoplasmata archaeon]